MKKNKLPNRIQRSEGVISGLEKSLLDMAKTDRTTPEELARVAQQLRDAILISGGQFRTWVLEGMPEDVEEDILNATGELPNPADITQQAHEIDRKPVHNW